MLIIKKDTTLQKFEKKTDYGVCKVSGLIIPFLLLQYSDQIFLNPNIYIPIMVLDFNLKEVQRNSNMILYIF